MKSELYGGRLMSAHHTGKPAENRKVCEGAHNQNKLALQLLTLKLKSKLSKLTI